jgi:hypothetical protein
MQPLLRRCALALGLGAVLVVPAGTASASVPGVVRADSPPSATDSVPVKTALARCPAGKQVTGVGGEITGGLGEVSMNRLEPNAALTEVSVTAEELGINSARQWNVQAYAMCADPIPGSQLVTVAGFSNGANETAVRAECPAGKRLLGAGGAINNTFGGRTILTGTSLEASTIAEIRGHEIPAGDLSNWRVVAHAICAPALPGQVQATLPSAFDSAGAKTRGIGCPAGKNLLGGAGSVTGAGEVVLDDLRPSPTGYTALAREDADGFGGSWSVAAGAICA